MLLSFSFFYQECSRSVYHYIKKGKGKNPYKPHTHTPTKCSSTHLLTCLLYALFNKIYILDYLLYAP